MLGAIAGDVIGSVFEGTGVKAKDFPLFIENSRFTDDTVLTVAVAERLLRGGELYRFVSRERRSMRGSVMSLSNLAANTQTGLHGTVIESKTNRNVWALGLCAPNSLT